MPLVSVIVINYNGEEYLNDCLSSLLSQNYQPLEIIVADNGSTDQSSDIVETFREVEFISLQKNHGLGKGNNLAAEIAHGDYLFFVNNDMRFMPDMISKLVEVAKNKPNLFALDCKQFNWDGDTVVHSAVFFTKHKPGGREFVPGIDRIQIDVDDIVRVPYANTANLFCEARRFRNLGGFDPELFFGWEDVDLCWRALLRGWESWYVPQAICFHRVSGTSNKLDDIQTFYLKERGHYRFIIKCADVRTNLRTLKSLLRRIYFHWIEKETPKVYAIGEAYISNLLNIYSITASRIEARKTKLLSDYALCQQFGLDVDPLLLTPQVERQ